MNITKSPKRAVQGDFDNSIFARAQKVRFSRTEPTSPAAEYVFFSCVILGEAT